MKRPVLCALFLALLLAGCGQTGDSEAYHLQTDHPLYAHYLEQYPDKETLLSAVGDCNADGVEDLVVVYREAKGENRLVAVYTEGNEVRMTAPIPAPVENCVLEWKDIDEKPPTELLVSGQKGIHIGYAVFRLENGEWVSLYGDGMDGCC